METAEKHSTEKKNTGFVNMLRVATVATAVAVPVAHTEKSADAAFRGRGGFPMHVQQNQYHAPMNRGFPMHVQPNMTYHPNNNFNRFPMHVQPNMTYHPYNNFNRFPVHVQPNMTYHPYNNFHHNFNRGDFDRGQNFHYGNRFRGDWDNHRFYNQNYYNPYQYGNYGFNFGYNGIGFGFSNNGAYFNYSPYYNGYYNNGCYSPSYYSYGYNPYNGYQTYAPAYSYTTPAYTAPVYTAPAYSYTDPPADPPAVQAPTSGYQSYYQPPFADVRNNPIFVTTPNLQVVYPGRKTTIFDVENLYSTGHISYPQEQEIIKDMGLKQPGTAPATAPKGTTTETGKPGATSATVNPSTTKSPLSSNNEAQDNVLSAMQLFDSGLISKQEYLRIMHAAAASGNKASAATTPSK